MSKALHAVELLERYWRHHRTRFLMPLAASLVLLGFLTQSGKDPVEFWDLVGAAFLSVLLYCFWIWDNRLPRVPKHSVGIVLAMTCEDAAHEKQVGADFVASLRRLLHSDKATTHFYFLHLPNDQARKCEDRDSANLMLTQTRGHCILFGSVRRRLLEGEPGHILQLEGEVRSGNTEPEVRMYAARCNW